MKAFSWIHLSDLHIGQNSQWLWPNFKSTFLNDIRRLSSEVGPIDMVFFTGDLTNRGAKTEFDHLTNELLELWELWDKLGNKPLLFTTPGNHDLARPASNNAQMKMFTRWGSEPDVIKEFWKDESNQYKVLVNDAFANYSHWQANARARGIPFIENKTGLIPGDAAATFEINDISVGMISLNSSFLQLNDTNFKGKLVLDSRQLVALTEGDPPKWCGKNDLNFLLTHHPVSWLSPDSAREYNSEIYCSGRFTAHLFGHMHEADLISQYRGGDAGRKHLQSSSLFGLEHLSDGTTVRAHGYSAGKIIYNDEDIEWRLWPRLGKINRGGDRKIVPDHDNFELVPGTEYQKELLTKPRSSQTASASARFQIDLAATVEEKSKEWANSLESSRHFLADQEQHQAVRILQQQACIETLRQNCIAWICSDWGLGRDGFIGSVLKRIDRETQSVFRISLCNYGQREEFLTSFATTVGCSFAEYCKALGSAGPSVLLFDDAPVSITGTVSLPIERDVEALARMVNDFCPEVIVLLLARTIPKFNKIAAVALEALDEADTRTYLLSHPNASPDVKIPIAVDTIHRITDGLPSKIDSTLKALRVVTLSELEASAAIELSSNVTSQETIPASLVKAVTELANSTDSDAKRSYTLLKALSLLPNGESLQRLKRIDASYPIFPKHAEELLDRDLIQIRSSTTMIGERQIEARMKILIAPRPVRDYVMTQMSTREIDNLAKKITILYFGESWKSGRNLFEKHDDTLISDDGSLLQNPNFLILRLLNQEATWENDAIGRAVLGLSHTYSNALFNKKHYRHCVSVCKNVLLMIPTGKFDEQRNSLELLLAGALRMTAEHDEARAIFEKLIEKSWPKSMKSHLYLGYALCLQSLEDDKAIDVAQSVIEFAPESECALQAKSIILDMENNEHRTAGLLKLERDARKRGYFTVANNLTLGRIYSDEDDETAEDLLHQVYATAVKGSDSYTASRAAVRLGQLQYETSGNIESADLSKLINAYQYFYGERNEQLFLEAHETLWYLFEDQGDTRNLLSLFKHSSFIWRLYDNKSSEKEYAQRLIDSARNILTTDILTADRNTAYFLIRARASTTELGE